MTAETYGNKLYNIEIPSELVNEIDRAKKELENINHTTTAVDRKAQINALNQKSLQQGQVDLNVVYTVSDVQNNSQWTAAHIPGVWLKNDDKVPDKGNKKIVRLSKNYMPPQYYRVQSVEGGHVVPETTMLMESLRNSVTSKYDGKELKPYLGEARFKWFDYKVFSDLIRRANSYRFDKISYAKMWLKMILLWLSATTLPTTEMHLDSQDWYIKDLNQQTTVTERQLGAPQSRKTNDWVLFPFENFGDEAPQINLSVISLEKYVSNVLAEKTMTKPTNWPDLKHGHKYEVIHVTKDLINESNSDIIALLIILSLPFPLILPEVQYTMSVVTKCLLMGWAFVVMILDYKLKKRINQQISQLVLLPMLHLHRFPVLITYY